MTDDSQKARYLEVMRGEWRKQAMAELNTIRARSSVAERGSLKACLRGFDSRRAHKNDR